MLKAPAFCRLTSPETSFPPDPFQRSAITYVSNHTPDTASMNTRRVPSSAWPPYNPAIREYTWTSNCHLSASATLTIPGTRRTLKTLPPQSGRNSPNFTTRASSQAGPTLRHHKHEIQYTNAHMIDACTNILSIRPPNKPYTVGI